MSLNKKILFVTIPEKGHINPMIGIAQQLQLLGYQIGFFAQVNIKDQLLKAGLNVPTFFDNRESNNTTELVTKGREFAVKLQDKLWMQHWIKTLLIDIVPAQITVIEKTIHDFNPSLIVSDPMVYAAIIAASNLKIPWVGVSSSLNPITPKDWICDLTDTLELYAKERQELFQNTELKPAFRVSDAISPWLNIVFSTEEYIPRSIAENNFSFYVGSSYNAAPRGDEQAFPFHLLRKDTKKIYMSLGSQVYYYPELFKAVQEVFQSNDLQLMFSINELVNTPFKNALNENVIAINYAPQLSILPHVDMMISHGGANSVMECLSYGKPIALLPICNDQFLQAKFVKMNKVGVVLDAKSINLKVYKDQLNSLLDENSEERINAQKIGLSFQKHNGPLEAAILIEKVFMTRRPLFPTI